MTAPTTTGPTRTTPFLDSSDLLGDPPALRARADERGYLFLRGLLPRSAVLDVRQRFLEIIDRHGWLAPGTPVGEGIADVPAYEREDPAETEFCGVGVTPAAYRDAQHVREFHQLSDHPRLQALYAALFDAPVLRHPRNIARMMVPRGDSNPTPPHQDFIHVQGSPNVWTAWLPLGDCPRSLGGLTVLDGSHHDGLLSYKAADGAGGLEAYLCNLDLTWAEGDFEAGDVLTFSSRTVHKALPNGQPDRVRLSCDFRYQPLHEVIERRALDVHCGVATWDEIYATWPDDESTWYWRDLPLRYVEWDESIRWQKDRIC
ncbi:phytanoyl-CoA dioxygenase family protein [Actinopolymorpha sp. B17G11]|uniref:phytanoyl-CoA dioxygenase family protein n=1 Tax=Actinopolymorpha sp. B17G11 TaxID=3160861 RepID=UPI0032E3C95D